MAPSSNTTASTPTSVSKIDSQHDEMPSANELMRIASKSLQAGALTGTMGMVVGAGSGIVRSAPPTLFALVSGLQWFALGSTYMASKSLIWHAWGGEENLGTSDLVKASGVAGSVSGMVGGMLRGPRNIIPGVLFFGTLGAGSSYISQKYKNREPRPDSSWIDSKWIPIRRLSDQDYEKMLKEKILQLETNIAVIDDNIASLKASGNPQAKSDKESTNADKKP
ncbi:hypothetical protein F5B20DRAFT_34106 [Whalleya microplaca]|nr:hypothetical protein F5B20DRAFT_34106 [Whalleya microplaca]